MAKTTIEFSDSAIAQLEQIADGLHTTKADVLRSALSLYAYIVKQLQERPGRILGIVNELQDNTIEKLIAVPGVFSAHAVGTAPQRAPAVDTAPHRVP